MNNEQPTAETLGQKLAACRELLAQATGEKRRMSTALRALDLLDAAQEGHLFTNQQDEILFINLRLLEILGYTPADRARLIGRPLPEEHWQHSGGVRDLLQQLSMAGTSQRERLPVTMTGGQSRMVALTATVALDERGRATGVHYIFRPLAGDGHRGTAELRAENRELAAITAIGRSVLSTQRTEEVVEHLLETVTRFFEVKSAWLYLQQPDGQPRVEAHVGLDPWQVAQIEEAMAGFLGEAQRHLSGQPALVDQGQTEFGPLLHQLGMRKVAVAPLVAHDQQIGLFVLGSHPHRLLTTADLRSLERIAGYAALALSNKRLYDELKYAYDELKRAQEQLVDAERQKVAVQMAGAAAHELNQPLTVLLGYSNLLARMVQEDDPKFSVYQKIEHSTRRISEVVARLGQIARYRTRDYVEGEPIMDIEAASRDEGDEQGFPP